MTKCDYCGTKIGFFSVMSTWLDKKKDLAIHDRCLKEWEKKNPYETGEMEKFFPGGKMLIDKEEYLAIEKWFSKKYEKNLSDDVKEIFKKKTEERFGQNDKIEISIKDIISREARYLSITHPHSKEEMIKYYEDEIEEIKKDEDYPNREKALKNNESMLNFFKQMKT